MCRLGKDERGRECVDLDSRINTKGCRVKRLLFLNPKHRKWIKKICPGKFSKKLREYEQNDLERNLKAKKCGAAARAAAERANIARWLEAEDEWEELEEKEAVQREKEAEAEVIWQKAFNAPRVTKTIRKRPIPVNVAPPRVRRPTHSANIMVKGGGSGRTYTPPEAKGIGAKIAEMIANIVAMITGRR